MPKLIIARHGATPYNEQGIWTGITDIDMSEHGYQEVKQSAKIAARYAIDIALSSKLQRARNTARAILLGQKLTGIPLLETDALNEKDYGVFTGKNKQQVRAEYGDDVYMQIRRSWDYEIQDGESLRDVYNRVMPIHHGVVIPLLEAGKTTLVASHNNTLRAYVKEIDNIPEAQASGIKLGTAEMRIYDYSNGTLNLEASHVIGDVH